MQQTGYICHGIQPVKGQKSCVCDDDIDDGDAPDPVRSFKLLPSHPLIVFSLAVQEWVPKQIWVERRDKVPSSSLPEP